MAGPQFLRNNEIKGLAHGFVSGVTEHSLCPAIPIANQPLPIGDKNRIRGICKELLQQSVHSFLRGSRAR